MRATWEGLSLRARLLLVGVSGVATALAIGGLVLYGALSVVSYRSLDHSARATAADVEVLLNEGRLPDPIPVTGSQVVQVLDARARVVAASLNADHLAPLVVPRELQAAVSGRQPEVPGSRVGLSSPLRVVAVRAGTTTSPRTIVVAQSVDDIQHTQRILEVTLLATYPVLLGILALIAWRVIGAALRPVEALRSSAEGISGSTEGVRLPVPASGDEVAALAQTLNSMLDRLDASRARQRSFIADAAHELRSPLASMQTQLEVSHRLGEVTPPTADLRAEVERMCALVEDLLVLARLDADSRQTGTEATRVDTIIGDLTARYPEVGLVQPPAEGGLAVRGRRQELGRALENVVSNALRHASDAVEISVEVSRSSVDICVSDDGGGIPLADRERVFERFTRLDEGRARDAGGSGLGLAIVRELVRGSGGDVTLEDAPDGGLRARLRFVRA